MYAQYTIQVQKKRNQLIRFLKSNKIDVKVFYKPIYKNKAYKEKKNSKITEKVSKKVLSIPISATISRRYQSYVVNKIKNFYG